MKAIQKDLLTATAHKGIQAEYASVQHYASQFKKYNNMTIREIDEVVLILQSRTPAGYKNK